MVLAGTSGGIITRGMSTSGSGNRFNGERQSVTTHSLRRVSAPMNRHKLWGEGGGGCGGGGGERWRGVSSRTHIGVLYIHRRTDHILRFTRLQ